MNERKSSAGNPWHDERGRFCSGPGRGKTLDWLSEHEQAYADADRHFSGVENADEKEIMQWIGEHDQLCEDYKEHFGYSRKSEEEYAARTRERLVIRKEVEEGIETGNMPYYQDEADTRAKHRILNEKLGDSKAEAKKRRAEIFEIDGTEYTDCEKKIDGSGHTYYMAKLKGTDQSRMITSEKYDKRSVSTHYIVHSDGTYELTTSDDIQEGMIVEYAPEWRTEGEEKYVHVIKEFRMNPVTKNPKGRVLISTINTSLALGSTEVVDVEMIQPASKSKVDGVLDEKGIG